MTSLKRPHSADRTAYVDREVFTAVQSYIQEGREGVFAHVDQKAFINGMPPIDVHSVAEGLKKLHPFRFKRYKDDALRTQVQSSYAKLTGNGSNSNGGATPTKGQQPAKRRRVNGTQEARFQSVFEDDGNDDDDNDNGEGGSDKGETGESVDGVDGEGGEERVGSGETRENTSMVDEPSGLGRGKKDKDKDKSKEKSKGEVKQRNVMGNMNSMLLKMYSNANDKLATNHSDTHSTLSSTANGYASDAPLSPIPPPTPSPAVLTSTSTSTTNPAVTRERPQSERMTRRRPLGGASSSSSSSEGNVSGRDGTSTTASSSPFLSTSTITYADLGGIESVLQDVRELIEYPLRHPEIYEHLRVSPPRGVLLHGPPGCGKTALAHAIAGELGLPFLKVSAPELVSGVSGESEGKIRGLFNDAMALAPSIVFIDELDAIAPKRAEAQREMERRIVAQLLTCMDSLSFTSSSSTSIGSSSSANPVGGSLGGPKTSSLNGGVDKVAVAEAVGKSIEGKGPGSAMIVAEQNRNKTVIVIGATNRPESLDSALRRAGRFDREISIGIPDFAARQRILQVLCSTMKVDPNLNLEAVARKTVGYVGADLAALAREAAVIAVNRIFNDVSQREKAEAEAFLAQQQVGDRVGEDNVQGVMKMVKAERHLGGSCGEGHEGVEDTMRVEEKESSTMIQHQTRAQALAADLKRREESSMFLRSFQGRTLSPAQLEPLCISQADFISATSKVQPTVKREGFATIPEVSWDDVGALDTLEEELDMAIVQPILDPALFESIGLSVPAGVLLWGPPGCGKTLIAKCVANRAGASFLSVKGPELLNQYVGQSEHAVRQVFERARQSSPTVIFFDEIDALCPRRGTGGNQVGERVVNQMLTELDGMESRRSVFVIAATNRPDIIDPAMLRPGRLDKLLYIGLPDAEGRLAILEKHVRRTPLGKDVVLKDIAYDPRCEGMSGADMSALVREATVQALREAQAEMKKLKKEKQLAMQQNQVPSMIPTMDNSSMTDGETKPVPSSSTLPPSILSSSSPSSSGSKEVTAANAHRLITVNRLHFAHAFSRVRTSVSAESRARYERLHRKLSAVPNASPDQAVDVVAATETNDSTTGDVVQVSS